MTQANHWTRLEQFPFKVGDHFSLTAVLDQK